MFLQRYSWCTLCLLLTVSIRTFGQESEVPNLTRRVTDLSNTLTSAELDALEQRLATFEQATSSQVVVVMLPELGRESIEDVSIRLAERNLIGQKGRDNGVLLLIAKNDRRVRIEVGYGLEGVLTDALSGQIIRNEIAPHFKLGHYYEGIVAGVEAIMQATRNEYQANSKQGDDGANGLNPLVILFLILLFGFLRAGGRRRRALLGGMGPIFHGGGWGGSGGLGGGFRGGGGSFGGGGSSGSW